MASTLEFAEYVYEQMAHAGDISYRKMFGSFGIYMNQKFIGLICDDQLFVKPTTVGRAISGVPMEEPPFEGAKDWFLIEAVEDRDLLTRLLVATWEELLFLKPKKPKK